MTDTQTDSPQRAEVDLDPHSPDFRRGPYGRLEQMCETGRPGAYAARCDRFWAVMDYTWTSR